MRYYRARTPYTEITALFGMKKEQFSKLLHTQNINKQWNIAIHMLRIRSEGFYQRQNCSDNNVSFSTNYGSKNNRYSVLANAIVSSIRSDENGGIKYDSVFEERLLGNKKLISVRLADARTKRRHREVYLKQSLYFGKKENVMKEDSVIGKRIQPTSSISYSFNANDLDFSYTEAKLDSNYYENIFFDSIQTRDSTHSEEFIHGIGLQTILLRKIRINADAEQSNRRFVQYNDDSTRILDSNFISQSVRIVLSNQTGHANKRKISWRAGKEYIIKGPFEFDDHVFGHISYVSKKDKKISFDIHTTSRSVPFLYNHYVSNHFWWKNNLETMYETNMSLRYKDKKNKLHAGAEMSHIVGYVYFDSTFLPKQHDTAIQIRSAFIQKNLHMKHFGFNNRITWQDVSDPDVLRLPQFTTNHSIYYEGKWFRKAVDVQLGLDITYYSSYFADAYMPALGQFYLQNEKEFGNYPFVDFFFNMRVRHAKIFFKSEHVNSGFTGPNYFLAPHMPAPDRSIKVGVRWTFYD